jgi:putative transposase
MRKVLKTKGVFPNQDAFLKIVYLGVHQIKQNLNRLMHNWNRIHSYLCLLYGESIPLALKL